MRQVRDSVLLIDPSLEFGGGQGEIEEGPSSWLGDFDGVPFPYALTGEVIRSYIARTEAGQGSPFAGSGVQLQYIAEAREVDEPEASFRIRMVLVVEWGCRPECTSQIVKGREVFLDAEGRLVTLTGDGVTRVDEDGL